MNKIRALLSVVFSASSAFAQNAQPTLKIVPGPLNTWDVSWQSIPGRTYFFQVGETLSLWEYAPAIELGDGGLIAWGFDATDISSWGYSSTSKFFVRLRYTDQPTANPDLEDFDGDGVGSLAELEILNTDPLVYSSNQSGLADGSGDSDWDDLEDRWEIAFFGNLTSNSSAGDPDGDGKNNEAEWLAGSDPTRSASDVDTDGDGLPNWFEVMFSHTNPELSDSNGDGISDYIAWWSGRTAARLDTDGDGTRDALDSLPLDASQAMLILLPNTPPSITLLRPGHAVSVP